MNTFLQVTAAALLAVVIGIVLDKQNKDISLVLTLAVCCMVFLTAFRSMDSVFAFFRKLQQIAGLDMQMVRILLKVVGIGFVAQIATLICNDSGKGAIGQSIQVLASVLILVQSLPMLEALMDLIQKILGET